MINFLNLKYFLILSEEMNFRKAAHKLYITQQSLSGHIQKLEEYFGVPLFYRSTPLRLTPAGIHLKNRAAELLTLESDLQKELLDISGFIGGSLTVGSTHVRTQVLLPSVLQVFNEKHPGVSICLFEGNTDEVEEALHSGTVDVSIGFLPKDTAQIISVPLYEEHFMVIIPNVIIQKYFPGHSVLQNGNPDSQFVLSCLKVCPFLSMTPDTKLAAYSQEYFRFLDFIPKPFLETKNANFIICFRKHANYVSAIFLIEALQFLVTVPAIQINRLFIAFQPGTDCLSYACSLIIGMHSNTGCIRCILFIRLYAKGSNHGMV